MVFKKTLELQSNHRAVTFHDVTDIIRFTILLKKF